METNLRFSTFFLFLFGLLLSMPFSVIANEPPPSEKGLVFGEAIRDFFLVNADTNVDIHQIWDGQILDFFDVSNKNITIRVDPIGDQTNISVDFVLTGPLNRTWTENVLPYALFGDISGDYNGAILPPGEYHLSASAIHALGGHLNTIEIHFTVPARSIDFEFQSQTSDFLVPFTRIQDGFTYFPNFTGDFDGQTSIKATPLPSADFKSIRLTIEGPISFSRIENFAPYSLFGDINGDFNTRIFPVGEYRLSATTYPEANGMGDPGLTRDIVFKIVDADRFLFFILLVDVPSDNELANMTLPETDVFVDIANTPTDNATVVVGTEACERGGSLIDCPGSMLLELEGPVSVTRVENIAPFTLFGDIKQGSNIMLNGQDLPVGEYTLRLTPFTGPGATGKAIQTDIRHFEIVDSGEVIFLANSVGLLDVDTGIVLDELLSLDDGNMIDINQNSVDNLTIRVEYAGDTYPYPGSVRLELNGPISNSRLENVTPYTLFGDLGGIINGGAFPLGNYTIQVTAYTELNGGGMADETIILPFSIIDSSGSGLKAVLYPNPTTALVHMDAGNQKIHAVSVLDMNGREVMRIPQMNASKILDVSRLEKGIYIVRMYTERGTQTKKIIIQ